MNLKEVSIVCYIFCFIVASCTSKQSENKLTANASQEKSAIAELTSLIGQHPKDADLYYKRGMYYHQSKQDSLALADLYNAIKIDSSKSYYFSSIADILFEHKDINGSVQWIQKAIKLNPDDAKAHLKIAKMFLFTQEYPKAFTEINTVLRTDVYNAEAYFLKGMCYKSMLDTNKAISSFQTAVQTDPKYAAAHMQLALIYASRKNKLAINYFENAFNADSSDMEPLYGEAMFWQDQNKFEEAKLVFKKCILINRNYEKSYYNIGWMLLQQDSIEKALRHFSMAIIAKPEFTEAYYNRGLCYELLEQYDSAYVNYQQALSLNQDLPNGKNALNRVKPLIKK